MLRLATRFFVLCSLVVAIQWLPAAYADPETDEGAGSEFKGVPDEIQTRQPPAERRLPKPGALKGSQTRTNSIGTLSTAPGGWWQIAVTSLRAQVRVLVERY